MKRFFLATFLMLAISAFVVAPALASDGCSHEMGGPDATVESLIMHVQHAGEMNHVKSGLVTALLAPLYTAANDTLPTPARVGALQAFIYLVNSQANRGIHGECAMHLVMQAEAVIDALTASE